MATCGYFFDGTNDAQCDLRTMLRSFIYQVISQRRKLMRLYRKRLVHEPQVLSDLPRLWAFFEQLISHPRTGSATLVLDAIDECSTTDQDWLVVRLAKLLSADFPTSVKMVVTSRPSSFAALEMDDIKPSLVLRLESRFTSIENDVRTFIDASVRKLVRSGKCSEANRAGLVEVLQHNSEATFLWVSLAVKWLQQRRLLLGSKDLIAVKKLIPVDLIEMYESLLDSIPDDDLPLARTALQFIRASKRPLRVEELDMLCHMAASKQHTAPNESMYFATVQSVESLLAGLVRTTNEELSLIHFTLKEYFHTENSHPTTSKAHHFQQDQPQDEKRFAEACMAYLMLERLDEEIFTTDSPATSTRSIATDGKSDASSHSGRSSDLALLFAEPVELATEAAEAAKRRFALLDYAATWWSTHYGNASETVQSEALQTALALYDPSGRRNWLSYLELVQRGKTVYPERPDSLTLATFLGHFKSVEYLVETEAVCDLSHAIYWAARLGSLETLSLLLHADDEHIHHLDSDGMGALAIAAAHGHSRCLHALLAVDRYDANTMDRKQRTPLSHAAGSSQVDALQVLLLRSEVDVNLADYTGGTPLIWAVTAGSIAVIRVLLKDVRTSRWQQDRQKRDAFSYACEMGPLKLAQCLWPSSAQGNATEDARGMTPLIHAVRSGHIDIVQWLLRKKICVIHHGDVSGRNALSWAAQGGSVAILKLLLSADASAALAEDEDGWSPLAWTMDPPERGENAAAILTAVSGAMNNEDLLRSYCLALSWKAFGVARQLISLPTFQVNTVSSTGRSALSYTAEFANAPLARSLLSQDGIDDTLVDESGRSAHDYAVTSGNEEVCLLLAQPRPTRQVS